ncbi:hypothetical protein B484DRAFT_7791, partial [Ochromonadaceae sp. CCMP2298]
MSFSFRQRVGSLDWRAITSLNTDSMVVRGDTKPLQGVLDIAIFSHFEGADVTRNSVESVSKLVGVLQLIAEYLLHCQEAQFKALRAVEGRCEMSTKTVKGLKRELLALKEERKIYQRQLALLRRLAGPEQACRVMEEPYLPPKTFSLYTQGGKGGGEAGKRGAVAGAGAGSGIGAVGAGVAVEGDLLASLMRREEETRSLMSQLLADQRQVFMQQIASLTDNLA